MSTDTIHVEMVVDYVNPLPVAAVFRPFGSDKIFLIVTSVLMDGDPLYRDMAIYHELGHVRHGHLDKINDLECLNVNGSQVLVQTDAECEADSYAAIHFPNDMDYFFEQLIDTLDNIPDECKEANREMWDISVEEVNKRSATFKRVQQQV